VTRIEADVVLGAPPAVVWRHVVEHERWPEWSRPQEAGPDAGQDAGQDGGRGPEPVFGGGLHLESVSLLRGQPDRVGTERECAGMLGPLPLVGFLGGRPLRWTDCVADVRAPWLMELDVVGARPPFARARLRLILAEKGPGETRLRLRFTYAPGLYWPLDVLYLRRAVGAGLRSALAGLHARYPATPATPAAPLADCDPVRAAA
jgi:hypothetical protein